MCWLVLNKMENFRNRNILRTFSIIPFLSFLFIFSIPFISALGFPFTFSSPVPFNFQGGGSIDSLTEDYFTRYNFEGDFVDENSNNDAVGKNGASFDTGNSGMGQTLNLDGVNDYVEAPDSSTLSYVGNEITISAWIKQSSANDHQIILSKPVSSSVHQSPYFAYSIHFLNGLYPRFWITTSGSPKFVQSYQSLSVGIWHHIVGVYDGSSVKIYVDGVLKGSSPASGNLNIYPTPLRIGTNGGLSEFFDGQIDDIKIYERALNSSEVSELYLGHSSTIYSLNVTKSGTGSGTVTGNGIDCGFDCGEIYNSSLSVLLTANASFDSTFVGWTDACAGTGQCNVNVDGEKTVGAIFNYVPQNPPLAPSGLTANALSSSSVKLDWIDNSNDEDGFELERSLNSSGPFNLVANLSANSISFSNVGLSPSTTYYYRVRAFNLIGTSNYSNIVNATTNNLPNPPLAPSGLTAFTISSSSIKLDWIDNSNDEDGFKIERSNSEIGPFNLVGSVSSNIVTFTNAGLSASTTYYYRVYSYNSAGTSNYSSVVNATTNNASQGFLAFWKLDEGSGNFAVDSSPNGNEFTLYGPTWSSGLQCKFNSCLTFDGTNDYVEAPNSDSLDISGNKLTVSAWINYDYNGNHQIILAKPASSSAHSNPYFSYSIHLYNGNIPRFYISQGTSQYYAVSNSVLSPGVWHHVAGVYDGSVMKIYIDGVEKGSNAVSVNLNSFNTPLRLGTNGGFSEFFKGSIDDVKIYDRALSASEIRSVYSGSNSPTYSLTVLKSGSGSGIVTGNGINCGLDCSEVYSSVANVSLNQISNNGSYFVGWTGECSGNGSCLVNIDGVKNVGVIFGLIQQQNPPLAPSSLTAFTISSSSIKLDWIDNSNDEDGFELERSLNSSGPFSLITNLSANSISFSNFGLLPSTTYYYRVRAFNLIGTSNYSNIVNATTNSIGGGGTNGGTFVFNMSVVDVDNKGRATIGDIDSDGYNDIIVHTWGTNRGEIADGSLVWYQYPNWEKKLIIANKSFFGDEIKSADINGDGDFDVVVPYGNDFTPGIYLYENTNGVGTSWNEIDLGYAGTLDSEIKDIHIKDIDLDGKLDIFVRTKSHAVVFYQNNITSWVEMTTSLVEREGSIIGDVDGDGYEDFIANGYWLKNPTGRVNNWVRYNIDPKWYSESNANWRDNAVRVQLQDLNGDGKKDVVFSQAEKPGFNVSWYESDNPAAGINSWIRHDVEVVDYAHTLRVEDWDNDGDYDILAGSTTWRVTPDVVIFLNDGLGNFVREDIEDENYIYAAAVGDIDNDGDLDFVSSENWETSPIRLWRNNVSSSKLSLDNWDYIQVDDSRDSTFFGITFSDLDNDSYGDIVSGKYIYKNPGGLMNGTWNRITLPLLIDAMIVTDVDGDQFSDVIGVEYLTSPAVTQNVYWLEATNSQATSWNSIVIGSIDKTSHPSVQGYNVAQIILGGKSEIILSAGNGREYYFVIPDNNPENGNWQRVMFTADGSEEGIGVGDVDSDGDVDIGSSGLNDQTFYWRENPGNGSSLWISHLIGSISQNAFDRVSNFVDINDDGKLDVVVTEETNLGGASTYWFEQPESLSSAWIKHVVVTQYTTNSLDVADMDNDGDFDIVTGEHRGNKEVSVWENDGNGNFTKHLVEIGKESHLGTRVFDLDGDGDLDVASIAYDSYPYLHLWRNDAIKLLEKTYSLTVLKSGSGSGIVTGNGINCGLDCSENFGSSTIVELTATANIDSKFIGWSGECSGTGTCNVSVNGVKSVTAVFNLDFQNPPSAPSGLTAFTLSSSSIKLDWIDNSNIEDGFSLERSDSKLGPFSLVANLSANIDKYTDTNLLPLTTYYYRVRSFNSVGSSNYSNVVNATTNNESNNLVSYWKLDEVGNPSYYYDEKQQNPGSCSGSTCPTTGTGKFDGGANFDGVNDFINIGNFDIVGTELTISAWFKADSFNTNDGRIISKANGIYDNDHIWMISTVNSGGEKLRFRLKTGSSTSTLIAGGITTGTWVHVVAVYDGANMILYKDGLEVGRIAKTGALATNPAINAWIGNNPTADKPFDGVIDDVRIYEKALSASEVNSLYNA